ncbi:hypothetical protein L3Q82_021975 [Scortum barcoo]|uniref:Uncharacterized protein n=1 Tax=Scortum barcoo TaxID=214431 RepID=A0ACB8X1F7_9TELE|nr:hypothetical protein L3Q82_021975 [Scortum barcoo]
MFFDFSSAFNTIQPRLLGDKLQLAGVDHHHLTTWILDYLTHRPQFVRVQGFESDRLFSAAPVLRRGTVLAPFLFTLYTADFSYNNTPSCHLQKFSDDSAVVGLITDGDDREYRGLIQDFADWCLRNNLQINAGKTKELVVDFRRRRHSLRLHRLHRDLSSGPFYDSVVASAIFYGIVCWASSITDRDRRRMDRLVRRASSVLGCPLDSVEVVGNGRMMAKLSSLLNNTSHPLQDTLTALGSSFSERLLHPRCVKERGTPNSKRRNKKEIRTFQPGKCDKTLGGLLVLWRGAQGEPALVCEKYRAPVVDLPILVFFSKCQLSSMVLGSEHRAHYRTSGPQATFMKSVPDCLGRDIHTSGPLEVIL